MRLTTTLAAGTLAVATAIFAAPLDAAPILGSAGAGLHTMGGSHENGARHWDGNSWDSDGIFDGGGANPCNAGSLASGIPCGLNPAAIGVAGGAGLTTASFNLQGGNAGFQAWGNGDGSADLNYVFGAEPGGALYDFTMLGEFTDDWNVNEIGWYEVGNPLNRHTIFGAGAAVGATAQVWIPKNFGFYYLNTSGNGETFFTQSIFNSEGKKQQFASFQLGDDTIVGVEDIFSNSMTRTWQPGTSDYDFNDVMFGFRAAQVPEPGTLLLVGMGIAGFAATRRRRAAR